MKSKRMMALALSMMMVSLTSCTTAANSSASSKEKTELIVFAAASMTETLTELGNSYMEEHENMGIKFNFDSSGTLKTQIQEGADCDIFISAGQKQMNQLDLLTQKDWTWFSAILASIFWRTKWPWLCRKEIHQQSILTTIWWSA